MNLCEYGCGQKAKYPPSKGKKKWSCEKYHSQCPAVIEKAKKKNTGKKRSKEQITNLKKGRKGKKNSKPVKLKNNISILCDYGCGEVANYFFTISKKYCCSDHYTKCKQMKKKTSQRLKNHIVSSETKNKIKKKIIELNKNNIEYKIKQSISRKYTLEDYQSKHPFFCKIEDIRENPQTGEIQVHCKNHNCPNSKEKGGWFTPTNIQLYERIRQLEKEDGNGGCYFYCCDACKTQCPLYNLRSDIFTESQKTYTQSEYQYFKEYVLERDNYICQYCGKLADHVHHERPQKLEPFFALDPDLAWSVCKKCHYKYGHVDECSTGKLANILCI